MNGEYTLSYITMFVFIVLIMSSVITESLILKHKINSMYIKTDRSVFSLELE